MEQLGRDIAEFFRDPENIKGFEEWLKQLEGGEPSRHTPTRITSATTAKRRAGISRTVGNRNSCTGPGR